MGWRARLGVVGLGLAAALAVSVPARASVTVGHNLDLTGPPPGAGSCFLSCVFTQVSLPAASAAAGGTTVPADGVLVAWRVRTGTNVASTMALRVVRDGARAVGRSAPSSVPATGGVYKFDTRLPVSAGDAIGLETDTPMGGGVPFVLALAPAEAVVDYWNPPLADGTATQPNTNDSPGQALYVQAELEPDCDRDGFGDETQDAEVLSCAPIALGKVKRKANGRATLSVSVPAAGEVSIAQTKAVKHSAKRAEAAATVKLSVRARGKAKRKLLDAGTVRVEAGVTYTPDSGVPQTASKTVKLKRKSR